MYHVLIVAETSHKNSEVNIKRNQRKYKTRVKNQNQFRIYVYFIHLNLTPPSFLVKSLLPFHLSECSNIANFYKQLYII